MSVRRRRWSGPQIVCLALALLPVTIVLALVANLVANSVLAISKVGLGLFTWEFSGIFSSNKQLYGLLPAIWGSLLTGALALGLGMPAALALAVLSTEFTLGPLSRPLGAVLGALSGIPPVVYAVLSLTLAKSFMQPKFCAPERAGLPPLPGTQWMGPADVPSQQSTLLGAIMLALLIIPFMAPLVADAIHNVPQDLREASYGLGVNHWTTLTRIVLPCALPGIISALNLGALKALGDVLISAWVIGFEPRKLDRLWDPLQTVVPLTATGAGLTGGFGEGRGEALPVAISVGYFAGLLLLLLAVIFVFLTSLLQQRLRRRLGL
jgi:phosphate transport system permease protein